MYRPLPLELTISKSNIDGLGLFTTEHVSKDHEFGVSHISDVDFPNGYIRTPLGGFVNHSVEPNCEFYKKDKSFPLIAKNGQRLYMRSIKDIDAGSELTVKYFLYDPEEIKK